jgi:hypothetical protein
MTLAEGDYRPRPPEQLAKLVSWGQQALKSVIQAQPPLSQLMTLKGGKLGGACERGSVIAKSYPVAEMPNEVLELENAASGPLARCGNAQGFGLTSAERRVV